MEMQQLMTVTGTSTTPQPGKTVHVEYEVGKVHMFGRICPKMILVSPPPLQALREIASWAGSIYKWASTNRVYRYRSKCGCFEALVCQSWFYVKEFEGDKEKA
jgi:hypothetical protein